MKSEKPVWHLRLYEKGGLRKALADMLPNLNKKFDQVVATIDYFENKISGEVLLEKFNDATREGARSGYNWDIEMPYTRAEGINHAQKIVAQGKRASLILTAKVLNEIGGLRASEAALREISFIYGMSRSSIRRAIVRETTKDTAQGWSALAVQATKPEIGESGTHTSGLGGPEECLICQDMRL